MRGQKEDYNGWRQAGNPGWDWDSVLPLFRKSEDHHAIDNAFHGRGGELRVERQRLHWPILDAVRDAAQELGIAKVDDFNAGGSEGSSYFEVNQKGGLRFSAVRAFLAPARKRSNLTILTHAHVHKLKFAGSRATSIDFLLKNQRTRAAIGKEVILSAGAIGSPQLLQLSGVGPAALLRSIGVPIVHDVSGVGENLQDHLQLRTIFRIANARTLNDWQASWLGKLQIAVLYGLYRRGPMSMAPSQLGIFMRSDPRYKTPNIEFHVQPLSLDRFGEPLHDFPALTVSVCNLRPESRGRVKIVSSSAATAPEIALSNAIRGHMAEYGLVAPVGRNGLQRLMAIIADHGDDRLPAMARASLIVLVSQLMLSSMEPGGPGWSHSSRDDHLRLQRWPWPTRWLG